MKEIEFATGKDIHGHTTLDKLSKANNFNNWIYRSIKPFLSGSVCEIGSGIGNITSLILKDGFEITVTETDETYLDILNKKFYNENRVNEIIPMDLIDPNFDLKFHKLFNSFDTVVAINVIEHIEDDLTSFRNIQKLLKPGGSCIVLVPNGSFLYNDLDKNLSHFRRYSKNKLDQIFNKLGFKKEKFFYFNLIGMLGWWFSGNVLKNQTIPGAMVNLFESIVPYTSWLDKLFNKITGLSIIVIAKK